jgi:nitrate reductase delta subunit
MKTFKALGALLLYPSTELQDASTEIYQAIESEALIGSPERAAVHALVQRLAAGDIYELQEDYTGLFDRARSLSLHLYEHVHGEARERGQAMVRLQTVYNLHGFTNVANELPDFLPLFCEFLSVIPEHAARSLLGDAATIIEALRARLERRQSLYAAVFSGLVSLAPSKVDPVLLEQISKGGANDAEDLDALDAAWAEAPVTFNGEALLGTCGSRTGGAKAHQETGRR